MAQIPPHLQNQIRKFQELQQKAELLGRQQMQLERELNDTERALTELDQLDQNAVVYKTIGAILVKSNKDKLKEELNDRKETLDMRIQTIKRQEERTKSELEEKQKEIQAALQQPKMGDFGGGFPGPM
ncbi:MAG TPA: prefoldin subunit beta [Candidatus Deferrimicrobium sp.]|nr:prefoldin subunit beta [Candidatus Deferrimicrobium sp.]